MSVIDKCSLNRKHEEHLHWERINGEETRLLLLSWKIIGWDLKLCNKLCRAALKCSILALQSIITQIARPRYSSSLSSFNVTLTQSCIIELSAARLFSVERHCCCCRSLAQLLYSI